MSIFKDLTGTSNASFKLTYTGVNLKNSSGNLLVRNSADSADASITTSAVNISGDSFVINSDAAGSGADWSFTINRPTSGMASALSWTLPSTNGTSGQVLSTNGSGVLSWTTAGSTSACWTDRGTTTIAFGSGTTTALYTMGATEVIRKIQVIIDTPFNGTPTLTIGISGTTSKYMTATQNTLTAAAQSTFEVNPSLVAQGAESLIATYSAGGASAGSARIIITTSIPS